MKKMQTIRLRENVYLLGKRKEDGKNVVLVAPSWDCGWYCGFGYIRTYERRDIYDHQHFDDLFFKGNIFDSFKNYFIETTLNDDEIWQLLGYMKEFYIMKKYAELLQYGNYITSKAKNILCEKNQEANKQEIKRINKILLPELFEKIDKLLTESEILRIENEWQK